MKFLLDTHVLIWYVNGNQKLKSEIIALIESFSNEIFVSKISFFEIAIKLKIGKMPNEKSLNDYILSTSLSFIEILDIDESHLINYQNVELKENHRDPFDRLLIATVISENMKLISGDEKFKQYSDVLDLVS